MRDFSNIKQRILQYIEFKGITKYEFYRITGLANGMLTQKNGMSEESIERFLSHFSDIDVTWLMTGKGLMIKNDVALPMVTSDVPGVYGNRTSSEKRFKGIPLIPISAMAGISNGTGDAIISDPSKLYSIPEFNGIADYMIRIQGDSMQPTYNSGDIVACKKQSLDSFFLWNHAYVLDTSSGALVKRISESVKEGYVSLKSDNPFYASLEIPLVEVYSIGLILGFVRLN